MAVYPCAAEPAIVFCCVLSDGKQVPAIPDRFSKSPSLRASGMARLRLCSRAKAPLQRIPLPPSTCLGFNSVLAHLSWVIKHERAEPRDVPVLCSAERGGGSLWHLPGWLGSKGSDVPTGGHVPPVPAAWTQRVHQPCRSCSGFILPMQCPRLPGMGEQSKMIPGRDGSTVRFTCYHATHNLRTLATYQNLPT